MYMINICEPLINVVIGNKPKLLIGLDQKGKRPRVGVFFSSTADAV